MNKRLIFLTILIFSIFICLPVKNTLPEGRNTGFSEDDALSLGLYLNIQELMEYRAERGLRNLGPHSIVLTQIGLKAYNEKREKEAIRYFNEARELSPDLPSPYLYLARANFSFSLKGIYKSLGYLLGAWKAFRSNFWWSFQTGGILFISLFLALYISIVLLFIILMFSKFRLFAHDILEDWRKIILLLPPVVLAFFGPIFGVIGFMLSFGIYMKRREKIVLYGVMAVLVLIFLALPLFLSFFGTSQNKTLLGIIKINEGIYTGEFSEIVGSERGYEPIFAYALDLKRKGHYNEAIILYKDLLNQREDAKVYNNLANCYVGLGDYDMALEYYKKALELGSLASIYYNLSQLYREIFSFSDAEEYYQKAIKIDPLKVEFFNSVKGTSVNRFVMDETLTHKELRHIALKSHSYYKSSIFLKRMLSFTNREFSVILLLLLIPAFYIYTRYVSFGTYRCRRCGQIYCNTCEKRISHEDICHTCFKTLVKTSELGAKERVEKILNIHRYRDRRNQRLKILTIIFPGSGHTYYGSPIYGYLAMFLLTFFISSALFWSYIPTPASMSSISSFFSWASVLVAVCVYGIAVINVFRRIPRKWL